MQINVPQCGYCQVGQIMQAAALLKWAGKNQNRDEAFFGVECQAKDTERSVNRGRRQGQARYFGIFRSKQFTIRILLDQFPQQLSREGSLIFPARSKG